jgi:hypothetical protein
MLLKISLFFVLCLNWCIVVKAQSFPQKLFAEALEAQKVKGNSQFRQPVICLVDFSKPSYEKRLWIIHVPTKEILLHTWVSHGRGSGRGTEATLFSNESNSHCSSLGTYLAAEPFDGIHGKSLRLVGLDKGINDNAVRRGIIFHSAPYMSVFNAKVRKRQGVSWGCFVVQPSEIALVIKLLKNGAMVYATK